MSASGTVEEIDEHLKSGKPAMVYFSAAPVRLDSVDDAQFKALREFRSACEKRGVTETYDSLGEFREKFVRQLAQAVIREFSSGTEEEVSDFAASQAIRAADPVIETLSQEARDLLLEAALDRSGTVMRLLTMEGLGIQTNAKRLSERGNARSEARWDAALNQLRGLNLLKDIGHKGEVFRLTDSGYDIADKLRAGIGAA